MNRKEWREGLPGPPGLGMPFLSAEALDEIRNDIRQGIKKHKLKGFLELEMEILDRILKQLIEVLFTYEKMRLWLQTKPGLAAELNVDLSHKVDPDDLQYMLTAAFYVGTLIPAGTAREFVERQQKTRTAPAREVKSSAIQSKHKKIAAFVIDLRNRHPAWNRQDVAHSIASGSNLTLGFVWGFPHRLACASLWDARANEHSIECRRSQRA